MKRLAVLVPAACGWLLMLAGLAAAAGCGTEKVVCPPGSRWTGVGRDCVLDFPNTGPAVDATAGGAADQSSGTDGNGGAGGGKDTSGPAGPDGGAAGDASPGDSQAGDGLADASPDSQGGAADAKADAKADTKADAGVTPKAFVGAACSDDYDCLAGLACFSWPKGYCTVPNCDSPGANCPGSSVCYGEGKASKLCHLACETDGDCRTADGYACKRLTSAFGGIDASLCAPSGKNAPGLGCTKASDCAGSATCLTDMPGGYCARIGCGLSDPCDAGQSCVLRNGKPTCLKDCSTDTQCQIGGGLVRKCVDKTDLAKQPVKVCLDSTKSSPVGAPCLSNLDCDTKLCTLFAKGTCSLSGQPCLTDNQCGAGGVCKADPAKEQGVCAAPCSADKACPAGSVCVGTSSNAAGSCQPTCKGPGDDASCGGVPGLVCLFGKPLPAGGSTAPAQYACAPQTAGGAGAPCTQTKDCNNALCLVNAAKSGGYCAPDCDGGTFCPFGAVCDQTGLAQCMRQCTGEFDCPPQFACKALSGVAGKVCLPP